MALKETHELLSMNFDTVKDENLGLKEKLENLDSEISSEKTNFDILKATHETTKSELDQKTEDLTLTKQAHFISLGTSGIFFTFLDPLQFS